MRHKIDLHSQFCSRWNDPTYFFARQMCAHMHDYNLIRQMYQNPLTDFTFNRKRMAAL